MLSKILHFSLEFQYDILKIVSSFNYEKKDEILAQSTYFLCKGYEDRISSKQKKNTIWTLNLCSKNIRDYIYVVVVYLRFLFRN